MKADVPDHLTAQVLNSPFSGRRRLIAVAGAPASGKSTLAENLAEMLAVSQVRTTVVPMDGFHLDNRLLEQAGLLQRKGAPETFDATGFVELVRRLKTQDEIVFPIFDRAHDIAIAGAGLIAAECETVIVEGNYLLFDAPIWSDLHALWDLRIWCEVPINVLRDRLIARWLSYGMALDQATIRAEENDLANAKRIIDAKLPADCIV